MSNQEVTFLKAIKGGFIAGIIGAGANNLWSVIAAALGATVPPNFIIAITMSSIFPVLVGGVLFFVFVRFIPKGKLAWTVLAAAFLLLSFFPVFTTPQLPDGTVVDNTFPLLVGPMHAMSGLLAIWGIPRFSK